MDFELKSSYQPTGDQPQAIAKLTEGVKDYSLCYRKPRQKEKFQRKDN